MSTGVRHYMSKKLRACDACRTRKRACRVDGNLPCDFCFRFGKPCVFTDATNRRKPCRLSPEQSGGSLTSIDGQQPLSPTHDASSRAPIHESLLDQHQLPLQTQSHSIDLETQAYARTTGQTPFDLLGLPEAEMYDFDDNTFLNLGHDRDQFMFNTYSQSLDEVNSPQDLQPLITGTEHESATPSHIFLDGDASSTAQFIGHSTDMDPYLLRRYRYGESGSLRFKKLAIQSLGTSQLPIQFLLSDRPKTDEIGSDIWKQLTSLIPANIGDRLVSLYQRCIARQYPVFGDACPQAQSAPAYLLAATYLTVQPYISFDERLCIELAYEGLPQKQLLDIFYHSLPQNLASPSLSTVQALFLMIISPGDPLIFEAPSRWTLFGMLVTCAHTLGLHLDPSTWNLAPAQVALRSTLSALVFSTDKWLAASYGKPPLLHSDNWMVTKLEQPPTFDPRRHIPIGPGLQQHILASHILSRTLHDLYSLRAINNLSSNPRATLDSARPLLEELMSWHRAFSTTLKPHHQKQQQQLHRSSGPNPHSEHSHLPVYELGYHYTRILILRAVIRPFVASTTTLPTTDHPHPSTAAPPTEALQNARLGIRSCTSDLLSYLRALTPTETAHTFWPPWASGVFSSLCYLLLLMVAMSADVEDARGWMDELQALRMELRLKERGMPVLRLGLLRVDSVFWKGVAVVVRMPSWVEGALGEVEGDRFGDGAGNE